MKSESIAIDAIRGTATGLADGVTAVVEVSMTFAVPVTFAHDDLVLLDDEALRAALAEGVDESLGQRHTVDVIEVGAVIELRDATTEQNLPLPVPVGRECFSGYCNRRPRAAKQNTASLMAIFGGRSGG